MKDRTFRLWAAMVLVIAAAIFGAVGVNMWFAKADSVNSAQLSYSQVEDYDLEYAREVLNTCAGPDEEAYLRIVAKDNPANGRAAFLGNAYASAVLRVSEPNEHGSYSKYEILATTDDYYASELSATEDFGESEGAANGERAANYPLAQQTLEWYIEKEFSQEYYPTYMELRAGYGLVRSAAWGVIDSSEDGGALVLCSVRVYSNPRFVLLYCWARLVMLAAVTFGGAAVIILTAKKYLQSV